MYIKIYVYVNKALKKIIKKNVRDAINILIIVIQNVLLIQFKMTNNIFAKILNLSFKTI